MPRNASYGAVISLLLIGSASNVIGKLIYSLKSEGRQGCLVTFSKPWFSCYLMFLGMSLCLPASLLYHKFVSRDVKDQTNQRRTSQGDDEGDEDTVEQPLLLPTQHHHYQQQQQSTWSLGSITEDTVAWWRRYEAVLYPTLFDCCATALQSIGLLFTTASLYQMMRGTEVIFTAILSVLILRRHLNFHNILGLVMCTCGLVVVGYSGVLTSRDAHSRHSIAHQEDPNYSNSFAQSNQSSSPGQTLLGIILVVISEAVQASQVISEDYLMSTAETKIPPVQVVGYEGVFGLVLMTFCILPVLQISTVGTEGQGLREDSIESIEMIRHSAQLAIFAMVYVMLMAGYNMSGMWVTDSMGALSRTVAETARTLLVWGVNLGLYYYVGKHLSQVSVIGEPWTSHSWLQAFGFLILVAGTFMYAFGEEQHAKKMRECLQRKAREEWSLLRASVPRLVELARLEESQGGRLLSEEERRMYPARPLRIAGPARMRVALALMQWKRNLHH